jgi:hypothetical protein
VVDPLLSAIGSSLDTHKERDVRAALEPLARAVDRTGAAALGVAHFNKGRGSDLSSLITGSGAFKNLARAVIAFAQDEEGGVLEQSKNSMGRMDLPSRSYRIEGMRLPNGIETARFVMGGESERSAREVIRAVAEDDPTERGEVATWLRQVVDAAGGRMAQREVKKAADQAGLGWDTVKRAKKRAGVVSRKAGLTEGWEWVVSWVPSSTAGPIAGPEGSEGSTVSAPAPFAPFVLPSGIASTGDSRNGHQTHPCVECGQPVHHIDSLGYRERCERCEPRGPIRVTNDEEET